MPKKLVFINQLAAVVAAFVTLPMSAIAIPLDTNTANGTATVGSGGDYATLSAAAAAFNGLPPPYLQGAWKLEIISDLTEANNSAFANTMSPGSSITLKPAATLTPTITFTKTSDNANTVNGNYSGNIAIGINSVSTGFQVKTDGFVIDGSNTVNGTTRDLTIQNTAVLFNYSRIVVILGDSDNCVIKNCIIKNKATAGTTPSAISVGQFNSSGVNYVPDGFIINNNFLQAQGTSSGGTIGIDLTKGATSTAAASGWIISNNDIDSRQRGIYLNGSVNGTISGNRIKVQGANAGLLCHAIYGLSGSSVNGQTLNVIDNNIYMGTAQTATGNFGAIGMALSSAVGTGCVIKYY